MRPKNSVWRFFQALRVECGVLLVTKNWHCSCTVVKSVELAEDHYFAQVKVNIQVVIDRTAEPGNIPVTDWHTISFTIVRQERNSIKIITFKAQVQEVLKLRLGDWVFSNTALSELPQHIVC